MPLTFFFWIFNNESIKAKIRKIDELGGQSIFWPWLSRINEDPGHEGIFLVIFYNSGELYNLLIKETVGSQRKEINGV